MRRRIPVRRAPVAIVALVAVFALAGAQAALALFTRAAAGGPLTVATATLSAPTEANAVQVNCRVNKAIEVALTWTATGSGFASSYAIERSIGPNGPYTIVATVPIGETAYSEKSGSLGYATTYYYRVDALYRSWSAPSAPDSVTTLSKLCA